MFTLILLVFFIRNSFGFIQGKFKNGIFSLNIFDKIDEKILFNRSIITEEIDDYYRLSNSDYQCLQRLEECSTTGWSLRFQMRLNSMTIKEKNRQILLFSTGGHEAYGDGIFINLIPSKPRPYLELNLKEYYKGQISYNWLLEMDFEMNQWIDLVTTVKKIPSDIGEHHLLTVYLDGYLYQQTILDNLTEGSIFRYKELYPRVVTIYANQSGLCSFEQILYYERVLTDEEISQGNSSQFVFFPKL